MKKTILSGLSSLLFLFYCLCIEIGCILLCCFMDEAHIDLAHVLLAFCSVACVAVLLLYNRIVTIVTYDPEKEIVSRRGLIWGFRRELRVSQILRTEVRMIPKEQEYILLLDREVPLHVGSLSPEMPIRIPNTAKGRAFLALFWPFDGNTASRAD